MSLWLMIYIAGVLSYYYVIYCSLKETEAELTAGLLLYAIIGGVYSWISWAIFYIGLRSHRKAVKRWEEWEKY